MVIGAPGAGKSVLARRLGGLTGLPVVHIDHIHWLPGWVERDKAEKIRMIRAAEAQEEWIIEGGLSATYAERLARAELLVWLDLPVALRLWRVTTRMLRWYGRARPDLTPGCAEQFSVEFYRYILVSRRRNRKRMADLANAADPTPVRRLRSPRAVTDWLAHVGAAGLP